MTEPPDFTDSMTLGEARDRLRELVMKEKEGVPCPCCRQLAKIYRRTIYSTIARALIVMYREGGTTEFVHIPSMFARKAAADVPKLRYWKLLEEDPVKREDGGRGGWWRVTPTGEQFIRTRLTLPKVCRVYDNKVLSRKGPDVSIVDCLGKRFNYRELMYGDEDGRL
jgi:hypothetical protein